MNIRPLIGLAGAILQPWLSNLITELAALPWSIFAVRWVLVSTLVIGSAVFMPVPWLLGWSCPPVGRLFFHASGSSFAMGLCLFSSVLIPFSPNIEIFYLLRGLQGLANGLTIPLLMACALRFLGPEIRLWGLACYALTATFPKLKRCACCLLFRCDWLEDDIFQTIPFVL